MRHSQNELILHTKRGNRINVSISLTTLFLFFVFSSFAQKAENTSDGRFHDDLLNKLVGTWSVSGVVHGFRFGTMELNAEWAMNHQYLRVHEKSADTIPWIGTQFERVFFIGYNHNSRHYVVHDMTVFGAEDPYEGFCYAYKNGNEIKLVQKARYTSDSVNIQRLTWQPSSGSWHIEARWMVSGKETELFIDQEVVSIKTAK